VGHRDDAIAGEVVAAPRSSGRCAGSRDVPSGSLDALAGSSDARAGSSFDLARSPDDPFPVSFPAPARPLPIVEK